MTEPTVVLCTLVLNEMEWLPKLHEQHRNWPGMLRWVFVEAADSKYAEVNLKKVSLYGLSLDGTTQWLTELTKRDDRVMYIPHGFCSTGDPAQSKCEARSRYLAEADKHEPNFVFVLDADEFYARDSQRAIMQTISGTARRRAGFCFRFRHPWRPPSMDGNPLFELEVKGGFWDIPLCRGWRWQPGLRYRQNHNTPETPDGRLLDENLARLDREPGGPECVHMAWSSSLWRRRAKNAYYAARGEGKVDHRGWYVDSRAAWETWKPGDKLPKGAEVLPWTGEIPEVFKK